MNPILPDRPVFICGHPKSGTSLLRAMLDSHPELLVYPELSDIQKAFPNLDPKLLGHDIAYPAMLKFLPVGFIGLMVGGLIAANSSTILTHLNWGSSYLVHDFYRRFVRRDAAEKHYVLVCRLTTIGLYVCAGGMGYRGEGRDIGHLHQWVRYGLAQQGGRLLLREPLPQLADGLIEIVAVGEDHATVAEAVLAISRGGMGMTAVVTEALAVVGIFTDGDLRRALEKVADLRGTPVTQVMTRNPRSIGPDRLAAETAARAFSTSASGESRFWEVPTFTLTLTERASPTPMAISAGLSRRMFLGITALPAATSRASFSGSSLSRRATHSITGDSRPLFASSISVIDTNRYIVRAALLLLVFVSWWKCIRLAVQPSTAMSIWFWMRSPFWLMRE